MYENQLFGERSSVWYTLDVSAFQECLWKCVPLDTCVIPIIIAFGFQCCKCSHVTITPFTISFHYTIHHHTIHHHTIHHTMSPLHHVTITPFTITPSPIKFLMCYLFFQIAKMIQKLANTTSVFESYMLPMEPFVRDHSEELKVRLCILVPLACALKVRYPCALRLGILLPLACALKVSFCRQLVP